MTMIGVVTQIDTANRRVWAELSRIAPGFHIGPLRVIGSMPGTIGDLVAVDEVQGQRGEYLCLGAITGGQPGGSGPSATIESVPFAIPGPLVVANPSALLLPIPVNSTFLSLRMVVTGAPTGSPATFDVLYNGTAQNVDAPMTSIFTTTKPSIPDGGKGYWNDIAPDTSEFVQDSLLRIDVTGVGSTSPGRGLSGVLRLQATPA
jgi:hypothetical protein